MNEYPKHVDAEAWLEFVAEGREEFELLEARESEIDEKLRAEGLDPDALGARYRELGRQAEERVAVSQEREASPPRGGVGAAGGPESSSGRTLKAVCTPAAALTELFRPASVQAVAAASAQPGGSVQTGDDSGVLSFTVREYYDEAGDQGQLRVLIRTRHDEAFQQGVATLRIKIGESVQEVNVPVVGGIGSIRIPFDPVRVEPDEVLFEVVLHCSEPDA